MGLVDSGSADCHVNYLLIGGLLSTPEFVVPAEKLSENRMICPHGMAIMTS